MKWFKARLKTAEEITGIKDCEEFSGKGWSYVTGMNELAKTGNMLRCEKASKSASYDYVINRFMVKEEWLKDIKPIINWETLKRDAKVVYHPQGQPPQNLHFAFLEKGWVCLYAHGTNSWTARYNDYLWCDPEDITPVEDEKEERG